MGATYTFILALTLCSIISAASEDEPICESSECPYPEGCEDPLKVEPCKALTPRFFYNVTVRKCQPFNWGGCCANCNNFESAKDCKKKCRGL
ncbi:hypothetical protein HPB50_000234 [Hyalomma asiaticum]|uniref:Uncharacterized protein n=1 Tax=Hyalomma asiaticum TaxID=266040 RepID=A0ACB7SF16_HYAAI|nr:hypothetical protein HPB50_000234 [Hyalomma asiaticum]